MAQWKELIHRLTHLGQRRQFDSDLEDEMRFHLEARIDELERSGLAPIEARSQARREFGNLTASKESSRSAWQWAALESILQDLRYGFRSLRHNPGLAAVAILSLALGAGANTAIFQLLNSVRLRSLPVRNPQELVEIDIPGGNGGFGLNNGMGLLTYPLWEQIRDRQEPFSGTFAWTVQGFQAGEGTAQHTVRAALASGQAFQTLGVEPLKGRLIDASDERNGCGSNPVVLGYGFWQREFGAKDSAIGSRLMLTGGGPLIEPKPFTIVGVTPPEFFGIEPGRNFDIAVPACAAANWDPDVLQMRNYFWVKVMGRLKSGWTAERAAQRLKVDSKPWFDAVEPSGYTATSMENWKRFRLTAESRGNGVSQLRDEYETSLWLLLGMTGMVLLIACANLANLLLARSLARSKEIAVRMAIGASRLRVIRQLIVESALLAGAGAAAGIGLAILLSQSLVKFLNNGQQGVDLDLGLDWRVLAFAVSTAVVMCLCFGLTTAILSTRVQATTVINASARGLTADRRRFSFQRFLIAGQVAVSLVLVIASLLFVRSFRNLFTVDAGFRQEGITFFFVDYRPLQLPKDRVKTFQTEVLEKIRAIPGVESASTSTHFPLSGSSWTFGVRIMSTDRRGGAKFTWISPHYFSTMEIPILAGRDFTELDNAAAPKAIIVNQAFVRQLLDGGKALGQLVRTAGEPEYPPTIYEIVGIVGDTKYSDLREPVPPIAYSSDMQHPHANPYSTVITRSSLTSAALESSMRSALSQVNPGVRINASIPFRIAVLSRLVRERLLAWLSGFFGVLAIVVASIGLYGIISYMTAGRRNEIGIRLALGATRSQIVSLVLRQMAVLLGVGLVAGMLGSLAAAGAARSLLFGLTARDPLTFVVSGVVLAVIAIGASFLPARRASRLDPSAALRED